MTVYLLSFLFGVINVVVFFFFFFFLCLYNFIRSLVAL